MNILSRKSDRDNKYERRTPALQVFVDKEEVNIPEIFSIF